MSKIECPWCKGDSYDPRVGVMCCNRPDINGECCGNPEPEPYPCELCEGYGTFDPIELAEIKLSGLKAHLFEDIRDNVN